MEKMCTCTRMQYQAETWLNVKLQYVQLNHVGVGPFVRSMKIVVHGFVTVLPDLPDLCANVRFVLRTRADMEVLAWAVTLGLDSYACAQWVVVVPFVKTVSGINFWGFYLTAKYELSL